MSERLSSHETKSDHQVNGSISDDHVNGKKLGSTSHSADERLIQLGLKYDCSEVGNMHRFVDQHRDKLRFGPERKRWFGWDGTRYRPQLEAEVHQLAVETAKSIFDEAKHCGTEEGQKKLTHWAGASQSESRLRKMISMASKEPELAVRQSLFDGDPEVINSLNGLVDLKTGKLVRRGPDCLLTSLAPVRHEEKAACPNFNRFLHDVFCTDRELISWFQRAVGYTLTGLTSEQVFFIAYGTGANGKSTLFETLLDILGDYGRAAEFDTFLSTDRGNTRVLEGVAKLQGVRFALASETDSTRRFSEALVKKITGEDTVTGSFLYGNSFEFRPRAFSDHSG